MDKYPVVFVVDDDPTARESVTAVLATHGMAVGPYASAEEFLQSFDRTRDGCLIVDVRMAEARRSSVLKKMQAGSLAELVRMDMELHDHQNGHP
jgi:FixJ family two-component response regulator